MRNNPLSRSYCLIRNIYRADTTEKPMDIGRSLLTQKTCVSDAIRVWNMAPENITTCTSQTLAKSEIKKFVRQLPI